MKLEVGKYYKTRDGAKAYVGAQNPFRDIGDAFQGFVHGYPYSRTWSREGKCVEVTQNHDLIAEWSEPQSGEVWVNVNHYTPGYRGENGKIFFGNHPTKEEADYAVKNSQISKRTARIKIQWREGQFDE